jgi:hypothetical protein
MKVRSTHLALIVVAYLASGTAWAQANMANPPWQQEFDISSCPLRTEGRNRYFILEPGYQLILEGGSTKVQITVLNETKMVAGVTARVVEEREWKEGKLYEVSRNYFALCDRTKDIFYFGEDVDYYENDKVVRHDGAWLAGIGGNRPGLAMPGTPTMGMRYHQEFAPGLAMDRAEIVSTNEICHMPTDIFANCMRVREETPLEPGVTEYKYHAPEVGLVQDAEVKLTWYGFIKPR